MKLKKKTLKKKTQVARVNLTNSWPATWDVDKNNNEKKYLEKKSKLNQ